MTEITGYDLGMNQQATRPELMSPAGGWPQLRTAIEAGADAVYFGLNHFSARAKVGFRIDELPDVMRALHERGVKGFVTFNTLVFDHELESAEQAIIGMAESGVDAVIVQDIGICQLIQRIAPELEIHGSTQMSVTSAQGVELAASLGCKRVVLGRELSLKDIRTIAQSTDVELEVFVHGALCVSYSGQCFSSEAWGGRSANRGKCAQACRLSYDLVVDGESRDLGAARYLLSPGDLCTVDQVPELIDIGISCLKIEGRYKDSAYVAVTTRAYREAIDMAMMGLPNEVDAQERMELEQIYSRGLGPHFISGTNHQNVVIGRAPRHRGVQVGVVQSVHKNSVTVEPIHPIKAGDGLVFDAADWRSPDEPEEGGNVYEASETQTGEVELKFGRGEVDFNRIRIGDWVWRTNDPAVVKSVKGLIKTEKPRFTRPIHFVVTANGGMPLIIKASLDSGESVFFEGKHGLEPAQKRGLDQEMLTDKLGRLGGSPFHLGKIKLTTDDPVFVPTSELNRARRELVEKMIETCGESRTIPAAPALQRQLAETRAWKSETSASSPGASENQLTLKSQAAHPSPLLHLLVRSPEQLEAAIEVNSTFQLGSITLDYLELYGLRPSVEKIKSAGITARVASPRILKPSEQKVIRFLLSLDCQIVVRSAGLMHDLLNSIEPQQRPQLVGDFSLNIANQFTGAYFLRSGVDRITPTYDLNAQQIKELTQSLPADSIETIAYSHLPVFHTEHCLFCRFLSEGTDNTNCGHPCEKHQVAIRDGQGRAHPVVADVGCRNTVFGAEAQTSPKRVIEWMAAGIRHFRLEFVHQDSRQIREIATGFHELLEQKISAENLGEKLSQISPQDTAEGSLFVPKNFQKLVQLS